MLFKKNKIIKMHGKPGFGRKNEFRLIEVHFINLKLLRQIRNECRSFMTRDNSEISKKQQAKWFGTLNKEEYKPFIFIKNGLALGYGAIKIEGTGVLISGGLLSKYRGHGYGKVLFEHLIKKAGDLKRNIELEVLRNNIRAIKVYQWLGFTTISKTDKIYRMRLHGKQNEGD